MLGAAEADAFRAKFDGLRRPARECRRWRARPACGYSSAQPMNVPKSPVIVAGSVSSAHVVDQAERAVDGDDSPSLTRHAVHGERCASASSIFSAPQPQTVGMPYWRATSAAWLVRPPSWVSTPLDASMPPRSSGLVSLRTRMTLLPFGGHRDGGLGIQRDLCPTRRRARRSGPWRSARHCRCS